jgi:hypothetical protein
MIRISATPAAFDAIAATSRSTNSPPHAGPGESYSDVIVGIGKDQPAPLISTYTAAAIWRLYRTSQKERRSLLRARNGMTALARTPVLPETTPGGAFPAQLRRPRPRSARSAIRRLQPAGMRKYRPFLC